MEAILVQTLGIVALILFIISYQVRSNAALFLLQAVGNVCFGIQFLLLGSIAGGISGFVIVVRNCMLLKINEWEWVRWKGWIVVITTINLVFTILTWSSIYGVFSFIATTASTVGFWSNNARTIRMYCQYYV